MKIKDIINPILSVKDKYMLAARIRKANPAIRNAIRRWKEDGATPTFRYSISAPGSKGAPTSISVQELVDLYEMDTLDAFLFIDSLMKADLKEDKRELSELLGQIQSVGCVHNGNVTDELLEHIRTTQPGVWEAYQKLLKEHEDAISEAERNNILEEDI